MSDQTFQDMLSSVQDIAAKADFTSSWKPGPGGPFTVVIEDVDCGTTESQKTKTSYAYIRPTFSVVDGDFEGRTFTDYMMIHPDWNEYNGKPSGGLLSLLTLATCLAGREVKDSAEAGTIVSDSQGAVLTLMSKAKRNGDIFFIYKDLVGEPATA